MHHQQRRRGRAGQSLVEAAVTLPMLLTLTLGSLDIGRSFYYREAVSNAARQGLRLAVASSQQATANAVCVATAGVATTTIPASAGSLIASIANLIAEEQSSDGTPSGSVLSGATVTVTWHCGGGLAVVNATNGGVYDPADARSDAVEVKVSYQLRLMTPFVASLLHQSALTVDGDVVGRMEY